MSEEDFRTVYRGGLWWIERCHIDGAWGIWAGPYKFRAGAEKRIEREQQWQKLHPERETPEEVT